MKQVIAYKSKNGILYENKENCKIDDAQRYLNNEAIVLMQVVQKGLGDNKSEAFDYIIKRRERLREIIDKVIEIMDTEEEG